MTYTDYLNYLKAKHQEFASDFPGYSKQRIGLIVQRYEYNHGYQMDYATECRVWRDYFDWVCERWE